jgi:MFS family permease
VLFFTAGVFLKPIAADMHWARSTVSFALSFAVFLSAVATPVLMDRRGVRAILTPGVAAFAASLGALALSPDLPGAFSRWPRSQASSARLRRRRPTPRRFRRRSTSAVASRSGSQWQG